jgi:hypothetical protein
MSDFVPGEVGWTNLQKRAMTGKSIISSFLGLCCCAVIGELRLRTGMAQRATKVTVSRAALFIRMAKQVGGVPERARDMVVSLHLAPGF